MSSYILSIESITDIAESIRYILDNSNNSNCISLNTKELKTNLEIVTVKADFIKLGKQHAFYTASTIQLYRQGMVKAQQKYQTFPTMAKICICSIDIDSSKSQNAICISATSKQPVQRRFIRHQTIYYTAFTAQKFINQITIKTLKSGDKV